MGLGELLIKTSTPYPILTQDNLYPGLSVPIPKVCRQCSKECKILLTRSSSSLVTHETCPFGVSVFRFNAAETIGLVIGVLDQSKNQKCPKMLRKQLNAYNKVAPDEIRLWIERLSSSYQELIKRIESDFSRTSAMLHDVKSAAGILATNANAFMDEYSEGNKPDLVRRIHASATMLVQQTKYVDLLVNPDAADFGKKKLTSVADCAFKMYKIFQNEAQLKGKTLRKKLNSVVEIEAFDSFAFILFVLLDNANKYGAAGTEITISCEDISGTAGKLVAVNLSVESIGPLIPQHERDKIFEKNFRSSVNRSQAPGSGLGLYIAQRIANVHGTVIRYSVREDQSKDGRQYGVNIFSVSVQAAVKTGK